MGLISNKNKRKALTGTILFHLILGVFFLFYGLKTPVPPPEEKMVSIEMDFGTSTTGSGNTESTSGTEDEKTSTKKETTQENTETTTTADEVATDPESEIASEKENKEEEEETETKEEKQEKTEEEEQEVSDDLKEAMEKFKEKEGEGGGEGDDETAGNEGTKEGIPDGKGTLGGAGGSWELSGRKILQKPQPAKPQKEGKVVINIWVDRHGNVVRTSPNLKESNTTDDSLFRIAEKAAKKARFNPKPDAAVEQKGKFTFIFKLR